MAFRGQHAASPNTYDMKYFSHLGSHIMISMYVAGGRKFLWEACARMSPTTPKVSRQSVTSNDAVKKVLRKTILETKLKERKRQHENPRGKELWEQKSRKNKKTKQTSNTQTSTTFCVETRRKVGIPQRFAR